MQMADIKTLDHIIDEMIDVVENSKNEIIHISEESIEEYKNLQVELAETQKNVAKFIEQGDELERRVQILRQRLLRVNKFYDQYSEEEVRKVYDSTLQIQTELTTLRQREKSLRDKRDYLERRLIILEQTIERATGLTGKISVVLTYLQDDFKHVNQLIETAKEKQEFSLQIIHAQEEERRRISREIHDGPAQMLANIMLRSELVERMARQGEMELAVKELKNVRQMVQASLYEVRHMIYDLRPMALDDLGLLPTIRKYVSNTAEHHQLNIEFSHVGKKARLKSEYEIAVFRLFQESIQNAIKHAEATKIRVKLEIDDDFLKLTIQDDGKGFDIDEGKRENSFGILGMKERVEMLDGELIIKSKQKLGTKVFIKIPYQAEALREN